MKWNEFKKEWKNLEKSRKTEVIQICGALLISGGIMLCGMLLWGQYSKELLDNNLKLAFCGVMIFCMGQFLFNYIGHVMLRNRIRRLGDGRYFKNHPLETDSDVEKGERRDSDRGRVA